VTTPLPGAAERLATRIAFFIAGLTISAWAPLVPLAKARLGLNDGQLGGLLLCLGLGSVLAMPLSGGLASRFGCRKIILAAGTLACLALPVLAAAPTVPALAAGLLLLGAGMGCIDVVMNIQAVIVERASGKSMMSGFHGLYSVGGIAGAGGVTGLLALKTPPLIAAGIVTALALLLLWGAAKGLLPYGGDEDAPAFALPKGRVLLMGALCFILFLAEGSVLDWSGVLLTASRGIPEAQAGIGYVAFSVMMTLGRLTGDAIVQRVGPRAILGFGASCAAAGFTLASLVPSWIASVAGFALVGVGASNVVPVLFTAAGNQRSMPGNLAIAGVTTLGYAGILLGPAVIGFVARASSLPLAFLIVAGLLVAVALCATAVTSEGASEEL
jgi:MFS family permease